MEAVVGLLGELRDGTSSLGGLVAWEGVSAWYDGGDEERIASG